MKELELLFKETEREYDQLQETKSRVMSSIDDRHKDLNSAVDRLLKIVDGEPVEEFEDIKSSIDDKSNEIDITLENTRKKLDSLLDELLS